MMTTEEIRAIEEATREWAYKEWKMYVERREEHYARLIDDIQMTREDFTSVERAVAAWNEWTAERTNPTQTKMGF